MTVSVGVQGGSVVLPDGSGVVFPSGALTEEVPVTVVQTDAAEFFDPSGQMARTVLSTTSPTSTFQENVEVRVALPAGATPADTVNVLAGVIDEETGAVTVEPSTIEMIDGAPFLVVRANHFTKRFFEWLLGKQPPSSALLTVPYYSQGSSPYCWAASLHMVTQAASFGEVRLLTDIIGRVGVDEGGIGALNFRMSSTISDVVKSRTGSRPDRNMWDYVNASKMKDYLWREIGVNGHPVAVFSSRWQHALVVVGYDMSTFKVHDPASTSMGSIGYTEKDWSEFVDGMSLNDKLVTLVVPKDLQAGREPVAANFLTQAIQFLKPNYGPDEPSALWRYEWDYSWEDGYSFRHASQDQVGNPIPGEVTKLQVPGEIQITNASRTDSEQLGVYLDITALDVPSGSGRLSTYREVTVGPNSVVNLQIPDIVVDTFRYNQEAPTEYLLTVLARKDGETVDRQSLLFSLGTVTPEITSLVPSAASVGDRVTIHGRKLGLLAKNNEVSFNGVAVDSVLSWADDEVTVVVPEAADTGPVKVKRGEVESNAVDFTISDFTTLNGSVTATYDDLVSGAVVNVGGDWTLQAVGARLESVNPDNRMYSLVAKPGELVQLTLSLDGAVTPSQVSEPDGSKIVYKPLAWVFDTSTYGTPFTASESGIGGSRTWSFTFEDTSNMFAVNVQFGIYADYFGASGNLEIGNAYVNGRTPAIFIIEAGN